MKKNQLEKPTIIKSSASASYKWTKAAQHHSRLLGGVQTRLQFVAVFLVTLFILAAYLIRGSKISSWSSRLSSSLSSSPSCDLFSGKWVYDNESYPLYKEGECSVMSDYLACKKNGRKDLTYQNWRWQPHQCDLPRFNGTLLLERLRNKRMVYVGDSINRGQWESMVCLVDSAIPSPLLKSMSYTLNLSLSVFKAIEYNATIEFYWSPLLVESNADDPVVHHGSSERLVRLQAIEKHAKHWTHAHVLVFNSYSWWTLAPTLNVLLGSSGSSDGVVREMKMLRSYEMALQTWSDWLQIHVNRSNTRLFWATMSPTHHWGQEWGAAAGSNCYNETEPITQHGYQGQVPYPEMMRIVEKTIKRSDQRGLKVQVLNITQLSEYRKEAHLSIHRRPWGAKDDKAQVTYPISDADCIHWCLPGVPDTWNELLYAFL